LEFHKWFSFFPLQRIVLQPDQNLPPLFPTCHWETDCPVLNYKLFIIYLVTLCELFDWDANISMPLLSNGCNTKSRIRLVFFSFLLIRSEFGSHIFPIKYKHYRGLQKRVQTGLCSCA
jgi:hypothetical protein